MAQKLPRAMNRNCLAVLQHSKDILECKIENEQGPKKRENTQIALDALLCILEEYIYQEYGN